MTTIFKTQAHAEEYLRLYDSVLARWPVPSEPLDAETSFGTTHLNACGPKDAPPLVLLPGFGANSTMYFANVESLSRRNRVYALDTMGQPGRSLPTRSLGAATAHVWLREVLDALGIREARMAGVSLGAWIALDFALRNPRRVSRIALMDPAASFAPMSVGFLLHSIVPFMIHPTRSGLIRFFRWMTRGWVADPLWGELMILGILNCKPQPPIQASPFADEQLRECAIPALLLIGGKSVIYDPQRVLLRATSLMRRIDAELLPDASHALLMERASLVSSRLSAFFGESSASTRAAG
jgi:pimeloyl-ACP methyl ester carboxylesterase